MKRKSILMMLLICSFAAQAQYKKASFMNKPGRTNDLSITAHFLSNAHSTALGIMYSYGRDKGTKRTFYWTDLEFLLPAKFSYDTKDNSNNDVNVEGKTSFGLTYRYNFGWYLLDNTNEDNKTIPFIGAGINFGIKNMIPKTATISPTTDPYYLDKQPGVQESILSYGGNLSAGVIYKMNSKIALKGMFAYNIQRNINPNGESLVDDRFFYYMKNHPYISIGIRFRKDSDN